MQVVAFSLVVNVCESIVVEELEVCDSTVVNVVNSSVEDSETVEASVFFSDIVVPSAQVFSSSAVDELDPGSVEDTVSNSVVKLVVPSVSVFVSPVPTVNSSSLDGSPVEVSFCSEPSTRLL
jgi:hypothetical protein